MAERRSGPAGYRQFRPSTPVTALGRLLLGVTVFITVSALAGLLLSGLILPVAGTVGLAAKAASDYYLNLPVDFRDPVLPQRTSILANNGSLIAQTWSTGLDGNRVVVPMSQINPVMPEAVVSIEDMRFYQHGAIDFRGTLRALVHDLSGSSLQGGSTIEQQYVKNVVLLEAGTNLAAQRAAIADTITRKITELKAAVQVVQQMPKEQILQNYLNLVYFGNGAYGVQTAAEQYFSTSAANLTVPQAAMLAAVINSPTLYDPFQYPAAVLARRNTVIADMANPALHYLTPAQVKIYQAAPLGLNPTTPQDGCVTATGSAAFFCNYVYDSFINDPEFGATQAERIQMWRVGGLTIDTTMNPTDESAADAAIAKYNYPTDQVATALAMVQPGTGQITAIAQSKPMGSAPGDTYLDLAADPAHSGTSGYQAGSSFKIFVGVAALEGGWNPAKVITVPDPMNAVGTKIAACPGNGQTTVTWPPGYLPTNDSPGNFTGPLDQAFWYSINTYFLTLEVHTGLCKPAQVAAAMGVTLDNDNGTGAPLGQYVSFTLGSNPITPIEMASAYATLAAQGLYCVPHVITGVIGAAGQAYPGQPGNCRQVVPPNIANEITALLRGVLTQQGATAQGESIGRPAAGKTGTSNGSLQIWFDGYTPQLATAVWTGYITPNAATNSFMGNMSVGGHYYSGEIYGATIPAPIWHDTMSAALAGQPVENFTVPTGYPPVPS